jgi:hypothetical protein
MPSSLSDLIIFAIKIAKIPDSGAPREPDHSRRHETEDSAEAVLPIKRNPEKNHAFQALRQHKLNKSGNTCTMAAAREKWLFGKNELLPEQYFSFQQTGL